MKRYISNIAFLSFLMAAAIVFAYEPTTHEELSDAAVAASAISTDSNLLPSLGLRPLVEKQEFPNSQGVRQNIIILFRTGANFEDNGTRPGNHFYNPVTGQGLSVLGITPNSSPDWAIEDKGDINGQDFSYKNARQYFYDALTKSTKDERDKNFGLTFQTLGQVIHHIQDMAQPQHVRDDLHCDLVFPCLIPGGIFGLYAPSLYEKYTDQVRASLPFSGYSPVYVQAGFYTEVGGNIFSTPRKFWRTSPEDQPDISQGKGMAEFTNRNFVSAGTNFDTALFPSPVPLLGPPTVTPIQTLLQEDGTCPNSSDPACQLNGSVAFYATNVTDSYTGRTVQNDRASTLSIFDQDLKQYNAVDPATGQPMSAFTLNRFNFHAAYPFLIPRAVAYSAGLVNYFFRGRIDIVPEAAGLYYRIRNLGSEPLSGEFALYLTNQTNGTRFRLLNGWRTSDFTPGGFLGPGEDMRVEGPGLYCAAAQSTILVFKGQMGDEGPTAGNSVGAVAAKIPDNLRPERLDSYVSASPTRNRKKTGDVPASFYIPGDSQQPCPGEAFSTSYFQKAFLPNAFDANISDLSRVYWNSAAPTLELGQFYQFPSVSIQSDRIIFSAEIRQVVWIKPSFLESETVCHTSAGRRDLVATREEITVNLNCGPWPVREFSAGIGGQVRLHY